MKLTPQQCMAINDRYESGGYDVFLGFQHTVCVDCGAAMRPLEPQGSRKLNGTLASSMICIECLKNAVIADIVA